MDPVLKAYAITLVALYFKTFLNSGYQGRHRIGNQAFVYPEDAKLFGKGVEPVAEDLPAVQRGSAAWRNDVENIPLFLFLGLVYYLVEASPGAAPAYFYTFLVARIFHTIALIGGLQPWRFIAFVLGQLCMMGMAVQILMTVL